MFIEINLTEWLQFICSFQMNGTYLDTSHSTKNVTFTVHSSKFFIKHFRFNVLSFWKEHNIFKICKTEDLWLTLFYFYCTFFSIYYILFYCIIVFGKKGIQMHLHRRLHLIFPINIFTYFVNIINLIFLQ